VSKSIGLLLVLGSMFAVGCSSSGSTTGGDSSAKAADTSKAGGGDSIGIQECDDYFKKMASCKWGDDTTKKTMDDTMKQNKDAWKQAASGPGKDTLKTTCKAALDALANVPGCK